MGSPFAGSNSMARERVPTQTLAGKSPAATGIAVLCQSLKGTQHPKLHSRHSDGASEVGFLLAFRHAAQKECNMGSFLKTLSIHESAVDSPSYIRRGEMS